MGGLSINPEGHGLPLKVKLAPEGAYSSLRSPDATEPRVASRPAPLNFSGLRVRRTIDRILPAESAALRGKSRIRSCALILALDGSVA